MRAAIEMAGSPDTYLAFPDSLNWGPIAPDGPAARAAWWSNWYDEAEVLERSSVFWARLDAAEHPVIWFSRNSADELSLFHACAARLEHRAFSIIEIKRPPPAAGQTNAPIPRVGTRQPAQLAALFPSTRPIGDDERQAAVARWRDLQAQNAPFRIVSADGLVSAPIDYFDAQLLSRIGAEPRWAKAVVLEAMLLGNPDYLQAGDVMLLARLQDLADHGDITLQGDANELWSAKVSRP